MAKAVTLEGRKRVRSSKKIMVSRDANERDRVV